jgi:hypothetical protein
MDITQANKQAIVDPYMMFYQQASRLYKDEQAIQSATASMYIRFNQLCDRNPKFNEMISKLNEQVKSSDISYNDIVAFVYAPLMAKSMRAKMYVDNALKSPIKDFFKFDEGLKEYLLRNQIGMTMDFSTYVIEDDGGNRYVHPTDRRNKQTNKHREIAGRTVQDGIGTGELQETE